MKAIGVVATYIVVLIVSAVWGGYVLTVLWGWFIVPVFELPALTIPHAIGLAMVVTYLTYQADFKTEETRSEMKQFATACAYVFIKPAIALGIGWIVQFWM